MPPTWPAVVSSKTAALYAGMSRRELQELRRAFLLDMAAAVRPDSIAFAAGRLALIDHELGTRPRRPYHAPKLTALGDIQRLIETANGNGCDGGGAITCTLS